MTTVAEGWPSGNANAADPGEPFMPHWSMAGCHVQTIFRHFLRPSHPQSLERTEIATHDDDFLEVFSSPGHQPETPVVVIGHGMEGNERSSCVQGLCELLDAAGWGSVVMVHRSCGSRMNRACRLYHSGDTADLATVVDWSLARSPGRPHFVVGYSLSGNQVIKWYGTQGASIPERVIAAAAVSPPFKLDVTVGAIGSALGGLYERRFLRSLVPKALAKASQHPGSLDVQQIRRARTLRDFDDAVTAVIHGFRDASDYYERSACGQFIEHVGRPLLVLASRDDPFSPNPVAGERACAANPWITARFSAHGGHLGFIEGTAWKPRYWAESELIRYFAAQLDPPLRLERPWCPRCAGTASFGSWTAP